MTRTLLNVIIDVSGSMNEMGKIHLQRNLCRYAAQLCCIEQEKYADLDVRFYRWAQNVSMVALQSDGDISALNAEGSSSLCVLADFIAQHLNDTRRTLFLILSDGNFFNSDIVSFQKQNSSFSDLIITSVAVGADADFWKLKKISTNKAVYLPENIASAIDSSIFGCNEPLIAPIYTASILESTPAETEETKDDWDA